MDVNTAINERRTVHLYRQAEIDDHLIRQGLELALFAPNHRFSFPWKFFVLGPKTRQELHELAVGEAIKKRQLEDAAAKQALHEKLHRKFTHPAAMVVFAQKRCDDPVQSKEDYAALACAIQNFCLAMTGFGYGSKWSTSSLIDKPEFQHLIALDPTVYEPVGLVSVGHSAVPLAERRRPSLEESAVFLD